MVALVILMVDTLLLSIRMELGWLSLGYHVYMNVLAGKRVHGHVECTVSRGFTGAAVSQSSPRMCQTRA